MTTLPPGVESLTDEAIESIRAQVFAKALERCDGCDDETWDHWFARAIEAKAARAGYLAGLEAAAKVCERSAALRRAAGFPEEASVHMDFAAAIRALGETK